MWAVPWRIREIRIGTVMIQFSETGDILLLPPPPNKMPCVMKRKPSPACLHTTLSRTGKGGQQGRADLSRLPAAVRFTFLQHYTEVIGLVQHSRYQECRHTYSPQTNKQGRFFCTTTIFIAKYITLRFCWVKKKIPTSFDSLKLS